MARTAELPPSDSRPRRRRSRSRASWAAVALAATFATLLEDVTSFVISANSATVFGNATVNGADHLSH